ncbi:phage integrase SAM-like domain-containing protein [Chloroflexota bacterium]
MRNSLKGIGLRDLIDGFLFSLRAEGRSSHTTEYYSDLLRSLLNYAQDNRWSHEAVTLDAHRVREFLSWVGSRIVKPEVGNGTRRRRKVKPSTTWPYYRALRRLFNWAVDEGYLEASLLATIRFKPPPAPPKLYSR